MHIFLIFLRKKQFAIFVNCFLFLCSCQNLTSQNTNDFFNQESLDSLKQELKENGSLKDLKHLIIIIQDETDPKEKLYYADLLIHKVKTFSGEFKTERKSYFLSVGYLQRGNALQLQGELHEALKAYYNSMEWAKKDNDDELSASLLVSFADTYSMIGNSESAEKYYDEALTLLRKVNDSVSLASALLNAGDEYYKTGQYDKALSNFAESGALFELLNSQIGKAYNKGNIGMVYAKQGKDKLAESNMNEAIAILEENEDYYPISEFLNYMSNLYQDQNKYAKAIEYAQHSLELGLKYGLKDQISDANLQLSQLLENTGNTNKAFDYYKTHIIYRDSVINLENVEKSMHLEIDKKELEAKSAENEAAKDRLQLVNERQKGKTNRIILFATVGVLFLIGLLAFGLFRRNKFVRATNKIIMFERERSDKLLLNILPAETAQELKEKGRVEAKKYPFVTVLFSDIVGFTSYAEHLSPEDLVKTIDHYFSKFDLIMEKYGLEKIKTIGDAYMAVGGLSFDAVHQAKEMVLAAKEMADFAVGAKADVATKASFDIRIGINTGTVVAGVVGTKKFAYDIWGDTVNIASRMESNSAPGRINISEDTYQLIKHDFECDYRGKLAVKNKGELKMYFINSL